MKTSHKKDYLFIILVFIGVVGFALLFSNGHQRMENQYPGKLTQLTTTDFSLGITAHPLYVGKSTGEEVLQVYPEGKTLGMSSVFQPAGQNNVFTFTKNSDVLTKVDIMGPGLITSRGIAVNDPFEKVVAAYGNGYVRSYSKNDPATFDAIYGSKQYLVFHVKNGIVQKIIIEFPLVDFKK